MKTFNVKFYLNGYLTSEQVMAYTYVEAKNIIKARYSSARISFVTIMEVKNK